MTPSEQSKLNALARDMAEQREVMAMLIAEVAFIHAETATLSALLLSKRKADAFGLMTVQLRSILDRIEGAVRKKEVKKFLQTFLDATAASRQTSSPPNN